MDVIQRARIKRQALAIELAKLDDFIKMADAFAAELQDVVVPGETTVIANAVAMEEIEDSVVPMKTRVLNACKELLHANGPMTKRTLFDALTARGISLGGNDPPQTLASLLSRAKAKGEFALDSEQGLWRLP